MATIGNFTKQENGGFKGQIHTLMLTAEIVFEPVAKRSDASPDFRLFSANAEIGAAWEKHSNTSGSTYLSVKLDDPSFAAPISCRLVKGNSEREHILLWDRNRKRD